MTSRIRRAVLGSLAAATVVCGARMAGAQSSDDALVAAVDRALGEHGLVGVTWSLVTPQGTRLGAAGLRERSPKRAMTPDTRVQVGSVTKTLVATGVLRLASERRIELDAPLRRYLPAIPLDNPWEAEHPVRVRHLLDHTSGLSDLRLRQLFTMRADPDAPLAAGLVRHGDRLRIQARPGERFSYSNIGYLILGMLIEQVTGARYERWLDTELLAPLGMTQSTFAFVSQVGARADTTMAMGYFDGVTPNPSYAIPVRPAAQFATTAADMARLASFLMSDGVVNGRTLVDSTLLRAMAVPTTTTAARAGLAAGYALGLVRRERWGIVGKCHLGNIGTFRAVFCLYPEHQRAFFASYNTDPEGANFDAVDSLFAAQLGVPPTIATTPRADASTPVDPARWNGIYVVRPHRFAQFAYLDEMLGVTRVHWNGSAMSLRPLQGSARVLEPMGGALFRVQGRRGVSHVLAVSADGIPVVSDGTRTFERVPAWRPLLLVLSAASGAGALLWLLIVGARRSLRAHRRGSLGTEPLRWSTVAVVALITAPLTFFTQPALAMGDPTWANVTVAIVTGALPVALLASLVQRWRGRITTTGDRADIVALVMALQWCVTLGAWGLLPLMLWR